MRSRGICPGNTDVKVTESAVDFPPERHRLRGVTKKQKKFLRGNGTGHNPRNGKGCLESVSSQAGMI
uniref:Uncharacterized protein n=1 Tax=Xenopus tropicalis TaxID=8364 RepID=A0A1B8Y067_XENTR